MKREWFALVLVVVLFFATGFVSSADCIDLLDSGTYGTNVTNFSGMFYINSNTKLCLNSYYLGGYSEDASAIVLNASNITLDCNGASITSNTQGLGVGISNGWDSAAFNPFNGTTIKNCKIYNYRRGIYGYGGAENTTIFNNVLDSIGKFAIAFSGGSSNNENITYNNITNGDDMGIYFVSGGSGSTISSNIITDTLRGMYLEPGFTNNDVISNTIVGADYGIQVYSNSSRFNNNNISGSIMGLWTSGASNNNFSSNTFNYNYYGILVYSGTNNLFINNTANLNENYGFDIGSGFLGNSFVNNSVCRNYLKDIRDYTLSNSWLNSTYTTSDHSNTDYLNQTSTCAFIQGECSNFMSSNITLTQNITDCPYNGIIIAKDNITLDCNGFSIGGTPYGYGVYSDGYDNVTIKNCNFFDFGAGIGVLLGDWWNILNNTFNSTDYGIIISGSSNNNITRNIASYLRATGIALTGSCHNNIIFNNTAKYNSYQGLNLDAENNNNNITSNIFCFNGAGYTYNDILFSSQSHDNFGSNIFDYVDGDYSGENPDFIKSSSCVAPAFVPGECGQWIESNLTLDEDILDCDSAYALIIHANNVTIDCGGHTISGVEQSGVGIVNNKYNGTIIKNCVIKDFSYGVRLRASSSDFVIQNSLLENNTFEENEKGLEAYWTLNNNITNNRFISNSENGLYLSENSNDSNIAFNNFTGNNGNAAYVYYSVNNTFSFNNFENNDYGIYLDNDADNNSILNNNFTGNTYGFYLNYADNNQIGRNFVDSTQYNFGDSSSCPFLYTWNGTSYNFISDMSTEGKLSWKTIYPDDYLKIDGGQLQPQDGKYNLKVTEEYDEISYIDQFKLITLDHSPEVDVFNGLTRADAHNIYTVSKTPSPVVSCVDGIGNDCLSAVSAKDGVFTMHPVDGVTNMITMDLGNLSNASEIKLIISYSWANGYLVNNSYNTRQSKSIEVKDGSGNWVEIFSNADLTARAALQKTYVLNLTNRFLTDDYSIRLVLPIQAIDYVSVDTTPQQEVIVTEYDPLSADLHYRGYSRYVTNITRLFFYDDLISQSFSTPSGNFTKYGDVLPLLTSTDDMYVITSHGDEISVSFPYEPILEDKDRDFLMFQYAYYKPATLDIGKRVDPLPFTSMLDYSYAQEGYPSDEEHQSYLREYNTRQMDSINYGGSLPSSINNIVFENTIIVGNAGTGLYLYEETNTQLLNNNISGNGVGISLDSSVGTLVSGNNISTVYPSVNILNYGVNNNIIENTLSSSSDYAVYINGETIESNNISHNIIIGDKWVYDSGSADNFYNDSYSGNIYYFANGIPSWEFYNITDLNADGWADFGSDLPFNSSMHSAQIIVEVNNGREANNLIAGWSNASFADLDWATSSSPTGSVAIAGFNFGVPENIINATFYVGTNLGISSINFPQDCWTNPYVTVTAYAGSNITVVCGGAEGPVEIGVIMGTDQLNEVELNWTRYGTGPWMANGNDWYPATTDITFIRSINVSLISPQYNGEALGPVEFNYNVSAGWDGQQMEFCNLSVVENSDLLGLWHFDNDLNDYSEGGADGTANGGEYNFSDYKFGNASYYLDGSSAIGLPDNSVFTSIDDFSVSAWVNLVESDGYNSIFSFGESGGDEFLFNIYNGNISMYALGKFTSYSDALVPLNEWHHVVAVRNGTLLSYYLDGIFSGSEEVTSDEIILTAAARTFGSNSYDSIGETFNGYLDDVAIWNKALSANEIYEISNRAVSGIPIYKNSSSLISINQNNYLSLGLPGGNYTWSISCTDNAGMIGTSETRSLVVNGTETVEEENQTSETQASSSYSPKIYFSDVNLPSVGNNFNLRYNDKIRFVVQSNNHTLTLNNFNSTAARVLIQSNPIIAYLQKGVLYEFDLNNDSVNDVKARYDGMNKTKAMIFIQEIIQPKKEGSVDNTAVSNEVPINVGMEDLEYSNWKIYFLIIALVLIVLFFIWKNFEKRIEEYFWIKQIERSKMKNRRSMFY